jgi:hypothetical protein
MKTAPTRDLEQEERSMAAGRAAGYCWDQNADGPGRCTWPPNHSTDRPHRDVYAHTEWT